MANGVAYAFDTHGFVKRLTAAGLSVEAAEALADEQFHLVERVSAKVEQVASKEELKEYKSALKEYKSDMKEDFKRLETSLDTKFKVMEERFNSKFDVLRAEMSSMKWVLGILAAGSIAAFVKSLF